MKKLNFMTILIAFVFGIGSLFSQKSITGTITADGLPLPGVSVIEQGTINGVNSDFDGNYTITLTKENSSLTFSYLGFITQSVSTSSANIDIVMTVDIASLEEVVVTGYGKTTRKTFCK